MLGTWTALITPFNDQNEIDLPAFRNIIREQISSGVTGIVPCGSTGESATLTQAEKKTLILTALEETKNTSIKVLAGTGSNNTYETVELSKWASDQGVFGVLVIVPYYNKPTQAGVEAHFKKVADSVNCAVVPYTNPSRTGIGLTAETVCRLAEHPRIIALKDSSANLPLTSEIMDLIALKKLSLNIICGDDVFFLPMSSIGVRGIISTSSNLFPKAMVSLGKALEAGQFAEATKIHQHYYPLFRDLFIESNPIPIKHAMAYAGWCQNRVRLPLTPLTETSAEKLKISLERCNIQPGIYPRGSMENRL